MTTNLAFTSLLKCSIVLHVSIQCTVLAAVYVTDHLDTVR